jgi:hypothetical protein
MTSSHERPWRTSAIAQMKSLLIMAAELGTPTAQERGAFDQGEVCATRKRLEIEDRSSIAARFAPQRIAIPINSNQRLPIRELRIKRLASATRLRTAAQLSICSIACQYAKICALRFFLTRVLFGHKLVTASQLYASLRSAVTSQRNCTPLETVLPTVFRAERTQSEKLNKTLTRTSA